MKKTNLKRVLFLFLCSVLVAAVALFAVGCNNNTTTLDHPSSSQSTTSVTEIGNGDLSFSFAIMDKEGKENNFLIKTNKTTVGDALLEHNIISGEEGQYGLYVKTVNGLTLDYDKDGYYWSFYVNGAYATSGVDNTSITEGAKYAFKAEKA